MALDLNISPYYEDYAEEKNYHKILFKPGVPVQARELTQSQTILQNQIKRVGDYLFVDGDKVTGSKPSVNLNVRTVRIKDIDPFGKTINPTDYLNYYVIDPNKEIIGYVEFVFAKDDPDIGDPVSFVISLKRYSEENQGLFSENTELYFYLDYTDALNKVSPDKKAFTESNIVKNAFCTTSEYSKTVTLSSPNQTIEIGDYLNSPLLTKRLYVTKIINAVTLEISEVPEASLVGDLIQFTKLATCPTSILTQDTSVFYKNGYLVRCPLQRIVPDKNTSFPSRMIGLFTEESIITSNDDESLLDPALESSNYFAQGADRLKIELLISSIVLDGLDKADTEEDFIPLLKFNKGEIEYVKDTTTDSVLQSTLAERTYDESGSYIVNGFSLSGKENTGDNLIHMNVNAGKAYVGGYQVSTVGPIDISIPPTTETETVTNYNVNTTQGTYWKIQDIQGELIAPQTILAENAFLELHNVYNPTSNVSKVGDIIFKNIEYDSYTTGSNTTYKLFIHYYAPINEVPPSWSSWSEKYGIPADEGQYIANVLYTNNDLLGTYGAARSNAYGLFREPDTAGVAYWWGRWVAAGRVIDNIKQAFINGAATSTGAYDDKTRILTNAKSYLQELNSSPFIDGGTDVYKIKSIVGVANDYTSHGTSATYASPFFYANISPASMDSTGTIVGYDQRGIERLVFPINRSHISSVTNIQTEYTKVFTGISFTGGVYSKTLSIPETFPIGDGDVPASVARSKFILLIKTGATSSVPYGTWSFTQGSVTISGNQATVTIDMGDPTFSGTADLSAIIESDDVPIRTKTLTEDAALILNINTADQAYSLGKSDIFNFNTIYSMANVSRYMGAWNSATTYTYGDVVTYRGAAYSALQYGSNISLYLANAWELLPEQPKEYYILDNGQRDGVYDLGSVKFIGPSSAIPGNVILTFDYFTHSGQGPIVAESYGSSFYRSIPTYRSVTDGNEFELRDCIDFRLVRTQDIDQWNCQTTIFPTSTVNTEADITYYLGRKDRIYLTNNKQNYDSPYNNILYQKGVSSFNPEYPDDLSDINKMCLAVLDIAPYAAAGFDIKITYEDNKRYTMRDIGSLEDSIIRLDKVAKLQSIEIVALKTVVLNESGAELLKTGILVEDFSDLDKMDLESGYVYAAVDEAEHECFPGIDLSSCGLILTEDNDIKQLADMLTMKFTEETFVSQIEANNTINVNPGAIDDGIGRAVPSKKNSLLVNLLNTAGAFITTSVVTKTIAAYIAKASGAAISGYGTGAGALASRYAGEAAMNAAYSGDSVLLTAWEAFKSLGTDFLNAAKGMDAMVKLIESKAKSAYEFGVKTYEAFSQSLTQGYQQVFSSNSGLFETGGVELSGAAGAGQSTYSVIEAWGALKGSIGGGWELMANGFSQIFGGNFGTGFAGVYAGAQAMATAINTFAVESLVAAAAKVYSFVTGGATWAGATTASTEIYAAIQSLGPFGEIIVAVIVVYVAVKILSKLWKGIKKLFSDERMKTNIEFIGKDEKGLNVYSFEYKNEFKDLAGHGRYKGYMAQEIEKIYPRAVSVSDNGYKMLNYSLIG